MDPTQQQESPGSSYDPNATTTTAVQTPSPNPDQPPASTAPAPASGNGSPVLTQAPQVEDPRGPGPWAPAPDPPASSPPESTQPPPIVDQQKQADLEAEARAKTAQNVNDWCGENHSANGTLEALAMAVEIPGGGPIIEGLNIAKMGAEVAQAGAGMKENDGICNWKDLPSSTQVTPSQISPANNSCTTNPVTAPATFSPPTVNSCDPNQNENPR